MHAHTNICVCVCVCTREDTDETNESCPVFFCPASANFICKWKVLRRASFCFWGGMAAHCVFGSGGMRRDEGLTEGVCMCVAWAQMKQPSPEARCPPAVAASLFPLPWPAATICSINQSPGASGANAHAHTHACTHTHIHRHTYFNNCLHSSCHTWPSILRSIPPSLFCSPPDASTIFLRGGHMAQWSLWIYRHICVYVATLLKGLHSELRSYTSTALAHRGLTNTLRCHDAWLSKRWCCAGPSYMCARVYVCDLSVCMRSDNW